MTPPFRHRFSPFPVSPGWLVNGWPRSIGAMQQVGFSQPCARDDLIALCAWAGLRVTKNRRRFATSGLTRIAGIATRNGRSNNYHHAGHFAHVVMAAAVLAGKAGIGVADRELLVLAALIHDLDHHGRRGNGIRCTGRNACRSALLAEFCCGMVAIHVWSAALRG